MAKSFPRVRPIPERDDGVNKNPIPAPAAAVRTQAPADKAATQPLHPASNVSVTRCTAPDTSVSRFVGPGSGNE